MIRKVTAEDPETRSVDLVTDNINLLKTLLPEIISGGPNGAAVNVDVLKALVGDCTVTDGEEKYGLNWHGKRQARQLALTPSTGTLRPCPEDSLQWDTTQNLMIEGDNLEVLKLLQKAYAGKVKLIYIDPPYNTGKDFVYPDDYRDSIKNYLELTGQIEGARKISSNVDTSGRFHTDWLNMMYPRLKLARNLLRDDGVIVISLDDGEASNAKRICDELFGEDNFIAQLTIESDSRTRQYDAVAVTHEYLLVYARDEGYAFNILSDEDKQFSYEDDIGGFDIYELRNRNIAFNKDNRPNLHYPFWVNPGNPDKNGFFQVSLEPIEGWVKTFPQESQGIKTVWRWGKNRARPALNKTLVAKKHAAGFFQIVKKYRGTTFVHNSVWVDKDVKTDKGTLEVKALFDNKKIFDHPKPVGLIRRISTIFSDTDGIVLDFFAGSGTSGHAAIAQNAADGSTLRYILVQLPEPLDPDNKGQKAAADFCDRLGKPRNIAELTKERLRRAAAKIKADDPMFAGDIGFRVFKLDSSNIRAWEPNRDSMLETLDQALQHVKSDRSEADILYELLLKLGLDLCVPIEHKVIVGKAVHAVGAGVLLACLAENISREDVEPLAQGIVAWHRELAPAGDTTVVFRDSAFADDVVKTNLAAILGQHGLANVRSL